jgi:hypothetical protein
MLAPSSHCSFDGWKGYWKDDNHIAGHPGEGVLMAACTFGSKHADIAGVDNDCMTSPHEDWKSLSCVLNTSSLAVRKRTAAAPTDSRPLSERSHDNSSLLLRVAVCQWNDKNCTGTQVYPDVPPVNVLRSIGFEAASEFVSK